MQFFDGTKQIAAKQVEPGYWDVMEVNSFCYFLHQTSRLQRLDQKKEPLYLNHVATFVFKWRNLAGPGPDPTGYQKFRSKSMPKGICFLSNLCLPQTGLIASRIAPTWNNPHASKILKRVEPTTLFFTTLALAVPRTSGSASMSQPSKFINLDAFARRQWKVSALSPFQDSLVDAIRTYNCLAQSDYKGLVIKGISEDDLEAKVFILSLSTLNRL